MESERFDDFEAELKSKILSLIFCLFSVASVLWCMFSIFLSLFEKLQSGLLFSSFSLVWVLFCFVQMIFFTKIYSSVHARWSIAQFRLLHSFVFNYKSVAVCKINVHDYRTGKNSWVRTIHVTLSISCLRYKTALSRDFSLVFCTKIPFFAALRANCYCSPFQKTWVKT